MISQNIGNACKNDPNGNVRKHVGPLYRLVPDDPKPPTPISLTMPAHNGASCS